MKESKKKTGQKKKEMENKKNPNAYRSELSRLWLCFIRENVTRWKKIKEIIKVKAEKKKK